MVWWCVRCTLIHKNDSCQSCNCCGAARGNPHRQQQAAAAEEVVEEVIDLIDSSDDEQPAAKKQKKQPQKKQKEHQQQAAPRCMGAGGSKPTAAAAAGEEAAVTAGEEAAGAAGEEESEEWDDDFQIELSEPTSRATSSRRGPSGNSVQKGRQQAAAQAAPEVPAPPAAAQQQQQSGPQKALPKAKKVQCKQQSAGAAAAAAAGAQTRAPDDQGSGASVATAVKAEAAGAAPRLKQRPPQDPAASITSGSPAPMPQLETAGSRGTQQQQQQQDDRRDRECSSEHVPASSGKPRQPPAVFKTLQLPPQPSTLLGKRSRDPRQQEPSQPAGLPPWPSQLAGLPQQPSALLYGGAQQQQQQQPVNPSLRLPLRRSPTGSQGKPSPPSATSGPSPGAQLQRLSSLSPPWQEGAGERSQEQLQFAPGPQAWQQGLDALYSQSAAAQQQAAEPAAAPAAAAIPGWVRRARRPQEDISRALVSAAASCKPVPLDVEQQQQQEAPPATVQGWLAYRVASQLPEAAACRSTSQLLQLGAAAAGAAAAAAAPPPLLGAALAGGERPGAAVLEPLMDISEAAARLLAGSRQQATLLGLHERTKRWFSQRSSTVCKELRRRLGDQLGAASGMGAGASGRRPPRPPAAGVSKRSGRLLQPSRLRQASAAAAAAMAVPADWVGVRASEQTSGRFTASLQCQGKQLWLGSYPTLEAAGRAADFCMAFRALRVANRRSTKLPKFNLPHNCYLQDKDLVAKLSGLPDLEHLKVFIKNTCGSCNK